MSFREDILIWPLEAKQLCQCTEEVMSDVQLEVAAAS